MYINFSCHNLYLYPCTYTYSLKFSQPEMLLQVILAWHFSFKLIFSTVLVTTVSMLMLVPVMSLVLLRLCYSTCHVLHFSYFISNTTQWVVMQLYWQDCLMLVAVVIHQTSMVPTLCIMQCKSQGSQFQLVSEYLSCLRKRSWKQVSQLSSLYFCFKYWDWHIYSKTLLTQICKWLVSWWTSSHCNTDVHEKFLKSFLSQLQNLLCNYSLNTIDIIILYQGLISTGEGDTWISSPTP